MRELSRQDLVDLLNGATVLGAGGGGEISEGLGLIDEALAAGKTFRLVTLDEAPDEALACTPYLLGAISDLPPEEEAAYARLPQAQGSPMLAAYDRLVDHVGAPFFATIACEMGGANTAVPFYVAAMRDCAVLDADPAGRAVPEITHSTYYLNNLPVGPMTCANEFGEGFVLEGVSDDARAEVLVRALAQVSRNDISAIDHALPIKTLRPALIPGTLERARQLGQVQREAAGPDVAAGLAQAGGGKVVFSGEVTSATWETRDGFTFGDLTLTSGIETYAIDFKNENMVGRLNGQVHATIPDLICLIHQETGEVICNPHAEVGQPLAVLILPAPAPFLTKRGLATFGPRYAGVAGIFKSPLLKF